MGRSGRLGSTLPVTQSLRIAGRGLFSSRPCTLWQARVCSLVFWLQRLWRLDRRYTETLLWSVKVSLWSLLVISLKSDSSSAASNQHIDPCGHFESYVPLPSYVVRPYCFFSDHDCGQGHTACMGAFCPSIHIGDGAAREVPSCDVGGCHVI